MAVGEGSAAGAAGGWLTALSLGTGVAATVGTDADRSTTAAGSAAMSVPWSGSGVRPSVGDGDRRGEPSAGSTRGAAGSWAPKLRRAVGGNDGDETPVVLAGVVGANGADGKNGGSSMAAADGVASGSAAAICWRTAGVGIGGGDGDVGAAADPAAAACGADWP